MTKSFNRKALGAFKKLGAVALITATLAMCFTACNQTGNTGGKPTPTPTPTKYTVTLNQAEHGKVTASPEIPANKLVVKDTVITFTATANAGYKVGKWKVTPAEAVQAGTGADGSPTAKVKITADTTVSVSFEAIPKHAITFSVDSTTPNGTLKAKADGVDETSTSPINVEEGKTVTFTATASDGYRLKGWTLDGSAVNGTNNSYSFTVSKAVSVKVSFEDASTPLPKHAITFSVDGANGTLTAKADGVPETATSPITVEEGKTVTFTATPSTGCKVKEWKLDGTAIEGNKTNTYAHTVTKEVTVKVSFEANSNPPTPQTKYTVTLNQTANGKVTASPEIPQDGKVDENTVITFTATANDGYKIGKWTVTGSTLETGTGADGSSTAKVKITANTSVTVSFERIPEGAILTLDPNNLTIEVKAKTEDGSDIAVEGCNETTLKSNVKTKLNATGTRVVLKGKITELYCPSNKLTELNVQGLTTLQDFICSYNQLTTLDVQGLTTLKVLLCHENQLTSLGVQGCTALQRLGCYNNKLIELNVQGLTALQSLGCCSNKLTELNVQGCASLQKLECNRNQLTALNVQGLTALQWLYCYHNQLTALNVQSLTSLQELYCYNNKLTTLGVQGCTSLQDLRCYDNQLTALNVQGLTALQLLHCYHNQLTALNVQGCSVLKKLVCLKNNLNAQAMTELLKALPARESGNNAFAYLYTEETGESEGNHKDFTQPAELKDALDGAKSRNWELQKKNASGNAEDI